MADGLADAERLRWSQEYVVLLHRQDVPQNDQLLADDLRRELEGLGV